MRAAEAVAPAAVSTTAKVRSSIGPSYLTSRV